MSEIILIGYNSNDKRGGKKEKFANRFAAAIAEEAEVKKVHDQAMRMYKERSNEIHEGNNQNITQEELKVLRCAVRKLVLSFVSFCKNNYCSLDDKSFEELKRQYVIKLLTRINNLQSNGLLQ